MPKVSDNQLSVFGIICLMVALGLGLVFDRDGALMSAVVGGIVACVTWKVAHKVPSKAKKKRG